MQNALIRTDHISFFLSTYHLYGNIIYVDMFLVILLILIGSLLMHSSTILLQEIFMGAVCLKYSNTKVKWV